MEREHFAKGLLESFDGNTDACLSWLKEYFAEKQNKPAAPRTHAEADSALVKQQQTELAEEVQAAKGAAEEEAPEALVLRITVGVSVRGRKARLSPRAGV